MLTCNTLFLGDNLDVLHRWFADGSVDLIYLDPPFNSRRSYSLLNGGKLNGNKPAPAAVFDDSWNWDEERGRRFEALVEGGELPARVRDSLGFFRAALGEVDLLAYLTMMAPRLVELRRVLAPTGSLYLHCDQSASHYLKILMDAVFGRDNFLNNVVWCYGLGGSSPRRWPRKHDDLLWYSREPGRHSFAPAMIPAASQRMKGQHKKTPDYWLIPSINNMARERLGYPTQKPLTLLERIVASSSREGELVLDPFCGSGTTLAAAEQLGRRWVGIDSSRLAVEMARKRLEAEGAEVVVEEYK